MVVTKPVFSFVFKAIENNEPGYAVFHQLIREEYLDFFFFESDPYLEYSLKFNFGLNDTDGDRLKHIRQRFASIREGDLSIMEYHHKYAFRGGMQAELVFQELSHRVLQSFLHLSAKDPRLFLYDYRYSLANSLIAPLSPEASIPDAFDTDMYEVSNKPRSFLKREDLANSIPGADFDPILQDAKAQYDLLRDRYQLYLPTNYPGTVDDFINYQLASSIMDQFKICDVPGRSSLTQK